MTWVFQLYLIILFIGSGLSLAVAVVAWRRREVAGAVPMTGLLLAVAWWQLMSALEVMVRDLPTKILVSQLLYLGVATVPVWWFLFALDYSNMRHRLPPLVVRGLWLIPALTMAVAFTQGWHAWLWSQVTLQADGMARYEYGWWFIVHALYSYALIGSGIILLLRTAWRLSRSQWRQMILLTVASLIPLVLNALYLTNWDWGPFSDLDLTAVGFAIAGLIMVWNVFGLHFFDLSPVARDLLVESMDDGVIVLDRDNRIIDINPAGQRLIRAAHTPIGQLADTVFAAWPELVERYRLVEQAQAEIRLDTASSLEPVFVELHISPLRNRRNHLTGRLITLHDVSRRRQTEMRLRQLSRAVEQSPASIMITDLDGRIQYVNPKFTQLTGYESHELIGRYSNVLKSGETSPAEYARLWQTIQAGHEWRGEFHNKKKDGELYWESAVISPISDAHGHITFFLAVKEDITNRKLAEAAERLRVQRLALVSDISMAINLSHDVPSVVQTAVDGLTRVLGVDQVGLALFDEARQHFYVRADHPAPGNLSAVGMELPLAGNLSMQRVLETHRPLMVLDAQHDPLMSNVQDTMARQQVQSILLVPLLVRDEVIGTIGVDVLHAPRTFAEDEIDLAQTVANLVAVRIEQARLFDAERIARQQAQRHAQDLTGLYAITRATSRSLVLEDVLQQALASVVAALQIEGGFVALAGADGLDFSLRVAAERSLPADTMVRILNSRPGASILAHLQRQREVVLLDLALMNAPEPLQTAAVELNALGWQTLIGIPLLHRDQSLGVLCLLTRQLRTASPFDMALYASMGHQVASAISNAQLFQTTLDERSRLKALIEASRDGIIMNGVDGTILVMNVPALTMLRLPGAPLDWVNLSIGQALAEMRRVAPQAARTTIQELRRLRTGVEPTAEGEYEIDGRPIHWQSLPVRVGLRPMGRLIVMRDMTEERTLEQLREDMTHTMVHDLRNPLTGIVTALNMVLDGYMGELSPPHRQVLRIAHNSSEHMMQLVKAILDVSRLESGRMPVQLVPVSPIDLVREAMQNQAALAHSKQLRLESDLPPDLPAVQADLNLMQRVLQNLIGNAVKFTPQDGCVQITARLAHEPSAAAVVQIAVSDTGPGIPLEIQSQLFQKFVTGGQQEHGSGLGLAFCKLAVEAHGQSIWVESSAGKGATFTFSLAVVV
jgi:NtrC-family two-component system sensor histidine kinase KinB